MASTPAASPWTQARSVPPTTREPMNGQSPAATFDARGLQQRRQSDSPGALQPILQKIGRIAGNMLLKRAIKLVLGRFMR
jgi:hypothetical protein